ncbi:1-acyl-sn-glycerol-3-phosphate acyltransferase gamma-like isoform X2 [Tachypleus tridentatus]|uniref:1-acyl-sn-glycerol-3-phosphate acyltransferase gamma-like isoform X2 n=2 Tax=Tachypleus tridentatus TaxID=6853 RepID=UPI003FD02036
MFFEPRFQEVSVSPLKMIDYVKSLFICRLLICLCFVLSGVILNSIQLCVYCGIRPFSKHLYRRVNYYLIYSCWALVAITEWWSRSSCSIYFADEETEKRFSTEHAIVLMNHKYEVDWLMCWVATDKFGILGSAKSFAKRSLKKIPVIGWGWIFAEMVFLERNWEKDSQSLGHKLDELVSYQDHVLLLVFAEGTRFTKDKYLASCEFAEKNNLPHLKYHLLPRTKGFVFTAQHLKGKIPAIYNVQLEFPQNCSPPTVSSILKGKRINGDMYVERIQLDDVPTSSEEDSANWLYSLYQRKDELTDQYMKTGTFPGRKIDPKPRITTLVNWVMWSVVVVSMLIYIIWKIYVSGNTSIVMIANTLIIFACSVMYWMIGQTKIKKSSSYGKGHTYSSRTGKNQETILNYQKLQPNSHPEDSVKHYNGHIQ